MPFLDYTGLITFWSKVKSILASKQNVLSAGEGVSIESDTVSVQEPIKELTKVEYDALTEEQKNAGLYVVTDAHINLNDHGDIYSTEETRIGTWIDGKPLYRKIISGNSGVINQWNSIGAISNLGSLINATGILHISSDEEEIFPTEGLGVKKMTEGRIAVYPYTARYVEKMITLIAEYIKTTDSTPTVSSVSTQSLSVNSLTSAPKAPEKVATSQVPLPSYVAVVPASASASSVNFTFAPVSASSVNFTFVPASASSTNLTL